MSAAETLDGRWLLDYLPKESRALDTEALRILELAYRIGSSVVNSPHPAISFSTLALALLHGKDETSRWFAQVAKKNGPKVEHIRNHLPNIDDEVFTGDCPQGRPSDIRLSEDGQLVTASARGILRTAKRRADDVNSPDIGVRHLVASYVLDPPPAHRKEMRDWDYEEHAWRRDFLEWVCERYTSEPWSESIQSYESLNLLEQQRVKGEALAFPGDDWTMRVLQCAADFQARQTDRSLSLPTVTMALLEQIRQEQSLVPPIWNALQQLLPQYRATLDQYKVDGQQPHASATFNESDVSPSVFNALETARGIARVTSNERTQVGILHLAAALLSRRVDSDPIWSKLGFQPAALRAALVDHVALDVESRATWQETLGDFETVTTGRPVELNSDEPEAVVRSDVDWANDPLGIRQDVTSFAALLASSTLKPPLAIGLFGPWGSGKTTFIKRLRQVIDQHTSRAQTEAATASPGPFVRNVVHVEFNAWHFSEEALISSLVDSIIQQIQAFIKNDDKASGEELAKIKSETVAATLKRFEEATQVQKAAADRVTKAEEAVKTSAANARTIAVQLTTTVNTAWKNTFRDLLQTSHDAPLKNVVQRVGEVIENGNDLQERLRILRSRPARMLADMGWPMTVLFVGVVLVLPIGLPWGLQKIVGMQEFGQALTALSSLASILVVWLRIASGAVSEVDRAIAQVESIYEKQVRDNEEVKRAESALADAQTKLSEATQRLTSAEKELKLAEADAAAATVPAQMLSVVSARIDDKTYSRELTTISSARRDLQAISRLLRETKSPARAAPSLRPVDRVILYIDDLDRCRPEDVVRVLQVVHMLLAFELFVVVVAVDARWVEQSLLQSYRWLSSKYGSPDYDEDAYNPRVDLTPQDYLEKIFQISFWLEPLNDSRAAEYLSSLVRESCQASLTGGHSEVTITADELDYLRALAAYVGPSPRRVKRLVNAYRLLKARLSETQLKSFTKSRNTGNAETRPGPYQYVVGLLVIATGAPALASQILGELSQTNPADSLAGIIASFRGRNHPDWTMAAQVLSMVQRTQRPHDVRELRGWAYRVGRFLLQGPR